MIFLSEAELDLVLNDVLPYAKKRQGNEKEINKQLNRHFSVLKARVMAKMRLQGKKKRFCWLSMVFYHVRGLEQVGREADTWLFPGSRGRS